MYKFNLTVILENWFLFKKGILVSAALTIICFSLGLVLGVVVAILRLSKKPILSVPALAYIEITRGTPVLVQLVWFYYCLPIIFGIEVSGWLSAIISLTLNTGAYLSEVFRAGIEAIPRGQTLSARALGFSKLQTLRRIILPQVFRIMIPPLLNNFINLLKITSLVSVLAVTDIMYQSQIIIETTYRPIEILSFAALLYFMITYPTSVFARWAEKRYGIVS